MIDDALLRPGRLEVHMEIHLPDEKGRLQITRIHTAKMSSHGYLEKDVTLEELARETKNFSGAEIEGLVRSATSFALARQVDPKDLTKTLDPNKIKVARADFINALSEVKPIFGADIDDFQACLRNGIITYGPIFQAVLTRAEKFIKQVLNSDKTPLLSILLEGKSGCGKTALSAHLATTAGVPFVKLISPSNLIGYSESAKCSKIAKMFDDAYKSPLSCIVIDDIERLLEYVPIGPRFSNTVLQTLLILLKKPPPLGKKLLVLCATSVLNVLEEMEFMEVFASTINIPLVSSVEEFKKVLSQFDLFSPAEMQEITQRVTHPIPIKKLLMIIEMTQQSVKMNEKLVDAFLQAAHDYGVPFS